MNRRQPACNRTAAWLPTTIAAALTGLAGCGRPPAPPPQWVQAESPGQRLFTSTLDTVSTLEAHDEVDLAAQAGGRVLRLLVRSGESVRAGQLLLVLDQTQLRAEVAGLQATAERDRINDERYQQLVRQGAATAIQRDEYRAAAIASREALRARLADLAYKDVRAPIAGVLGDITIKPGDVIQAGMPFSRIIRNQQLQARIDIPANQSPLVRPGQRVQLLGGAQGPSLATGAISSLDPGINPSTQTLLARAMVNNPDGLLRNGQRLRTRVLLAAQQRPAVPFSAVVRQSGQAFVFTVGTARQLAQDPGQVPARRIRALPAGTLVALQRPVQLGPLEGGYYPLLSGLQPDERLIRTAGSALRHGTPVQLLR